MGDSLDKKVKLYVATVLASIIYIVWRIVFTIPSNNDGLVSLIAGIILLCTEISGMLESIHCCYGMDRPKKPEKPFLETNQYPNVDVFITTYNESVQLLYKTIIGCINMDYPDKRKVHIFLCDDGDRHEMMELSNILGVRYISRKKNTSAKAGNLNNALKYSDSPYIVAFDADMIPLHNFLMNTIPYFFIKDKKENAYKKVGFIQTPQSFYNADLFQYNLYSETNVPNEQDYFYRYVQLAKNKTNSCIFGGSNAVLSRKALEDVGGFYRNVITEDFATGINIQAKGYICYAVDDILAIGLSPTNFKSLVKQRERWARGSIQTFKKLKVLTKKGLTLKQKFSYVMSINYWFMSFRVLTYILSPILFSIFNVVFIKCNFVQLAFFWLPQYILSRVAVRELSGNVRNQRLSNIYDTLLFAPLLKAVFLEMIGIKEKKFIVTDKENPKARIYLYQIKNSLPHIILWVFNFISIIIVIKNIINYSILGVGILFWLLINAYNLTMAIFFMCGRKIHRMSERFIASLNFEIKYDNVMFEGKTSDISEGGFSIVLDFPYYVPYNKICSVNIFGSKYSCNMKSKLVHVKQIGDKWKYGFKIVDICEEEIRKFFTTIYDRIPSLPQEIKGKTSIVNDIQYNIINRISNKRTYNRKIVRVNINKELSTLECGDIRIREFNYEYLLVEDLDYRLKSNLTVMFSDNMYFDCTLKKEYKRSIEDKKKKMYKLYKINNFKDYAYNEEFKKILDSWISENKRIKAY